MTNEILKAYKFRIYPDKEQQTKLNQTFGCVRVLWNHLVANFNSYGTDEYQEKYSEKEIKSNPDLFFLKDVSAAVEYIRVNTLGYINYNALAIS